MSDEADTFESYTRKELLDHIADIQQERNAYALTVSGHRIAVDAQRFTLRRLLDDPMTAGEKRLARALRKLHAQIMCEEATDD